MQQLLSILGCHFFPEQKTTNHQFLLTFVKLLLRQILQLLAVLEHILLYESSTHINVYAEQDIKCCLRCTVSGPMWPSALKSYPK